FAWSSHLDRHMRTHAATTIVASEDEEDGDAEEEPPPPPQKCTDCGKRLNHQTDPQRFKHKWTQTPLGSAKHTAASPPWPFCCEQCGKTFSQSSNLLKHQSVHSSERPYPCPECERCFCWGSALAKHRRTHVRQQEGDDATQTVLVATDKANVGGGSKPYPCRACGKSFG
ncbi:ZNF99 protein, partial [Geococcyx californianus]|nr:ZNF99 protein [Geococcyx californianus]